MPTLTVKIPESAQNQLTELVKRLGGEVVSVKTSKAEKKDKLLTGIREGLQEVKAIREGKLKSVTMDDLLNGE